VRAVTNIVLRPDLKTSGGEIHDILMDGRYAGNMTLVFREGDRIGGSIQLDSSSITSKQKELIVSYVRDYVQDVIMAIRAADCDIVVTSSPYDHIISTNTDELGQAKVMDDVDEDEVYGTDDSFSFDDDYEDDEIYGDESPLDLDQMEMEGYEEIYELVIVGEQRNKIEYHVYDRDSKWVAEAFFRLQGTDCIGEINFMIDPSEDEIEAVTDLIVSDFDEDAVDEFKISVKHRDNELEFIELTHEDLLDTPSANVGAFREDDFTVTLARDDGDILTYEIYNQARGGLPIGTATVDIATRQLAGFIDFQDMCSEEDREIIASLLMRELDKERDYKELNLSMLHRNMKIDEMHFVSEQVH
jgi:hypothetical protein